MNISRRRGRLLGASVLCVVLLLGLGARPALARTTVRTHAQVEALLAALRVKANGINARIQLRNQELARLQQMPQTLMVQLLSERATAIRAGAQAELQTVQSAIDLVGKLDASLDAAARLSADIRIKQAILVRLEALGIRTPRLQARINRLQNDIQNDRAALQKLQQQIAVLQQQVSQLFG